MLIGIILMGECGRLGAAGAKDDKKLGKVVVSKDALDNVLCDPDPYTFVCAVV